MYLIEIFRNGAWEPADQARTPNEAHERATRSEPPKLARLAILCAASTLLASVIATTAQQGPLIRSPAELALATGGATLCGNNPFCQLSRITR